MSSHPLVEENSTPEDEQLIERLVERKNMMKAYSKLMRNKGAAGIDKKPVESLKSYLKGNWPEIKEQQMGSTYRNR